MKSGTEVQTRFNWSKKNAAQAKFCIVNRPLIRLKALLVLNFFFFHSFWSLDAETVSNKPARPSKANCLLDLYPVSLSASFDASTYRGTSSISFVRFECIKPKPRRYGIADSRAVMSTTFFFMSFHQPIYHPNSTSFQLPDSLWALRFSFLVDRRKPSIQSLLICNLSAKAS